MTNTLRSARFIIFSSLIAILTARLSALPLDLNFGLSFGIVDSSFLFDGQYADPIKNLDLIVPRPIGRNLGSDSSMLPSEKKSGVTSSIEFSGSIGLPLFYIPLDDQNETVMAFFFGAEGAIATGQGSKDQIYLLRDGRFLMASYSQELLALRTYLKLSYESYWWGIALSPFFGINSLSYTFAQARILDEQGQWTPIDAKPKNVFAGNEIGYHLELVLSTLVFRQSAIIGFNGQDVSPTWAVISFGIGLRLPRFFGIDTSQIKV